MRSTPGGLGTSIHCTHHSAMTSNAVEFRPMAFTDFKPTAFLFGQRVSWPPSVSITRALTDALFSRHFAKSPRGTSGISMPSSCSSDIPTKTSNKQPLDFTSPRSQMASASVWQRDTVCTGDTNYLDAAFILTSWFSSLANSKPFNAFPRPACSGRALIQGEEGNSFIEAWAHHSARSEEDGKNWWDGVGLWFQDVAGLIYLIQTLDRYKFWVGDWNSFERLQTRTPGS